MPSMASDPAFRWSPGLAAAAEAALTRLREQAGVRRTALFWLEPAGGHLACVATSGDGGGQGWVGHRLAAGFGMAGRAVAERRPVWTPDLLAEPGVPIAPWLRERLEQEGLRTVAAVPVWVDGRVTGALGFLSEPGRRHEAASLEMLECLAADLAAALATAAAGPP
jgi:GAF domain-containing protein